jgi:hypothetical protein
MTQPIVPREYTVVYASPSGIRRELYLMATSLSAAAATAMELVPPGSDVIRVYLDPNW